MTHIKNAVEYLKGTDKISRPINATYLNGKVGTDYASMDDLKTGDYSGYLYQDSNSVYHIKFKSGSYIIDAPKITMSDGTTKENTILTTNNISETGLFVPMSGTINTPMTGGIWMKGAFDIVSGPSGMTPANGGTSSTRTKYADNYWGEKGLAYHYYSTDSTYGKSGSAYNYGMIYKPLGSSGASGYYTGIDVYMPEGLTVALYKKGASATGGWNDGSYNSSYLQYANIQPDGDLTYYDGTTKHIANIKNIHETIIKLDDNGSKSTGVWLAKSDEVTSLVDGQLFLYKVAVAGGESATTLKINSLTAYPVYCSLNSQNNSNFYTNTYLLLAYEAKYGTSSTPHFRVVNLAAGSWALNNIGINFYSNYYITNMFATKTSKSFSSPSAGYDTYTDITITGGSTGKGTWHATASVSGINTSASYATYWTCSCTVMNTTTIRVWYHTVTKYSGTANVYVEVIAFKYF